MQSTSFAPDGTAQTTSTPSGDDDGDICLLELDGGGVRGLSELYILKRVMDGIDPINPPKPCDYFDMIGGTSTGGLIAIMLGRLRMSVDECIIAYTELADIVFTKKSLPIDWWSSFFRLPANYRLQGRFDTEALKNAIIKITQQALDKENREKGLTPEQIAALPDRKRNGGEALLRDDDIDACKVFVCATSKETNETVLLTSYASPRWDPNLQKTAKIWEAGRATAAATTFFDTMAISVGGNTQEFRDGAFGANNPLPEMWTEATDMFCNDGQLLQDRLKCLVSIGTGMPSINSFDDTVAGIGHLLKNVTLETHMTAEKFAQNNRHLLPRKYFRFDVERGLDKVGLEEAAKKGMVLAATNNYLKLEDSQRKLKVCSDVLKTRETIKVTAEIASAGFTAARADVTRLQRLAEEASLDEKVFGWIRQTVNYQSWVSQRESMILWHADPQRRDTSLLVLSMINGDLIATKQEDQSNARPCIISHFCNSKPSCLPNFVPETDASRCLDEGLLVLRSIISQLLHQEPYLIHSILRGLPRPLQGHVNVFNCFISPQGTAREMRKDRLHQLLSHALKYIQHKDVRIYVDGITKMESLDRFEVLSMLLKISTLSSRRVKIFITTELKEDVREVLKDFTFVDQGTELKGFLQYVQFSGMQERRTEVATAEINSVEWIWDHPKFVRWRAAQPGSDYNILWIRGKPGSGKSTLGKYIQENLRQMETSQQRQPPGGSVRTPDMSLVDEITVVDHFYSARKRYYGTDHLLMLRSIIYQLIQADPALFDHLRNHYEGNQTKPWYYQTLDLDSSLDVLRNILSISARFLSSTSSKIFIIVDAMDESDSTSLYRDESDSRTLQNEQKIRDKILQIITDIGRNAALRIKWIVLSRPALDIENKFLGSSTIVMEEINEVAIRAILNREIKAMKSDIMVGGVLNNNHDYQQSLRESSTQSVNSRSPTFPNDLNIIIEEIDKFVCEHADGVVLWVVLILMELRKYVRKGYIKPYQVTQKLKSLPKTLQELYEDMIARLDSSEDRSLDSTAMAMFTWACFTERPLTVREFRDAISIGCDGKQSIFEPLDLDKYRSFISRDSQNWSPVQLDILDACGCFLEVARVAKRTQELDLFGEDFVSPEDTVQILHQTAKDFLLKGRDPASINLDPEKGMDVIGTQCERYVYDLFRRESHHQGAFQERHLLKSVHKWTREDWLLFTRRFDDRPLMVYILDTRGPHVPRIEQFFQKKGIEKKVSPYEALKQRRDLVRRFGSAPGYLGYPKSHFDSWVSEFCAAAAVQGMQWIQDCFGGGRDTLHSRARNIEAYRLGDVEDHVSTYLRSIEPVLEPQSSTVSIDNSRTALVDLDPFYSLAAAFEKDSFATAFKKDYGNKFPYNSDDNEDNDEDDDDDDDDDSPDASILAVTPLTEGLPSRLSYDADEDP